MASLASRAKMGSSEFRENREWGIKQSLFASTAYKHIILWKLANSQSLQTIFLDITIIPQVFELAVHERDTIRLERHNISIDANQNKL